MKALTDEERRRRKDALADVAAGLFAETGYQGLTVEQVARKACIGKGSVFLAFSSKEDLVLHAVRRRFDGWFDRLQDIEPAEERPRLAQRLLQSLHDDRLLLPLLALVGPVLEQECSSDAVVEFKEALSDNLGRLADRWARSFPEVEPHRWLPLFQGIHALIVGAWGVGGSTVRVQNLLADRPELRHLQVPFDDLFLSLVEVQLNSVLPVV